MIRRARQSGQPVVLPRPDLVVRAGEVDQHEVRFTLECLCQPSSALSRPALQHLLEPGMVARHLDAGQLPQRRLQAVLQFSL